MSRPNAAVWAVISIFWTYRAHSASQRDEFFIAVAWLVSAMIAAYVALIFYDKGAE